MTEYYISNLTWSINWSWWEKKVQEISGLNCFKALNEILWENHILYEKVISIKIIIIIING